MASLMRKVCVIELAAYRADAVNRKASGIMETDDPLDLLPASARDIVKEDICNERSALKVGKLIHTMRKGAELTQVQLATILGIDQAQIARLEKGASMQGPTTATLEKVADACGFTLQIAATPKRDRAPPPKVVFARGRGR